MTQIQNSKRSFRSFLAATMLTVGSGVLLTYSVLMAWQFHSALDSGAVDSLGWVGSIGFASLRVVRAVTLGHAVVLSTLRHILVLFSAFVVTLAGIALLPRRASGVNAPGHRNLSAPAEEDQ